MPNSHYLFERKVDTQPMIEYIPWSLFIIQGFNVIEIF